MEKIIALFDACVLYPAPLRDLLMRLALTDLFQAKWTDTIHEEWIKNVLAKRPDLSRHQLERTRQLMDLHANDCLVKNYQDIIPSICLPDPNDRHVLAAAIKGQANIIVTFNLKDFRKKQLEIHKITALHPDIFIKQLIEQSEESVCETIKRLVKGLQNPPYSIEQYLERLEMQSLPKTVLHLKKFLLTIDEPILL